MIVAGILSFFNEGALMCATWGRYLFGSILVHLITKTLFHSNEIFSFHYFSGFRIFHTTVFFTIRNTTKRDEMHITTIKRLDC